MELNLKQPILMGLVDMVVDVKGKECFRTDGRRSFWQVCGEIDASGQAFMRDPGNQLRR